MKNSTPNCPHQTIIMIYYDAIQCITCTKLTPAPNTWHTTHSLYMQLTTTQHTQQRLSSGT